MRAFPVQRPSGVRYWTVVDEDFIVVPDADAFLRRVRFGKDQAELTTRTYAGHIALFLRWCARTGRDWRVAADELGLFVVWLKFRFEGDHRRRPADGQRSGLPGAGG